MVSGAEAGFAEVGNRMFWRNRGGALKASQMPRLANAYALGTDPCPMV